MPSLRKFAPSMSLTHLVADSDGGAAWSPHLVEEWHKLHKAVA
jgi:hypothetical protein